MAITLLANPSRDIDGTHTSYAVAVGHPTNKALFHFRIQSAPLISIGTNEPGLVSLLLDVSYEPQVIDGAKIFFYNEKYGSVIATINSHQTSGPNVIILTDYTYSTAETGGYVYFNEGVITTQIRVSVFDATTDALIKAIVLDPMPNKEILFDAGPILRDSFESKYEFTGTGNESDQNNSQDFYIKYAEVTDGVEGTEVDLSAEVYYSINAVMKPGDKFGQNMGQHVAFEADLTEENKALFLTEFKRPRLFPGYPFGLGFIKNGVASVFQEDAFYDAGGNVLGGASNVLPNTNFQYLQRIGFQATIPAGARRGEILLSTDGNTNPCLQLSQADFETNEWYLETDDELLQIWVQAADAGLIDSINSYPSGVLYDDSSTQVDTLSHVGNGFYVPDNGPHYVSTGTWRAVIDSVPVTLGANACAATFDQSFVAGTAQTCYPGLLLDGYGFTTGQVFDTAPVSGQSRYLSIDIRGIWSDIGATAADQIILAGADWNINLANNRINLDFDGIGTLVSSTSVLNQGEWYKILLIFDSQIGQYDISMTITNEAGTTIESGSKGTFAQIAGKIFDVQTVASKGSQYFMGKMDFIQIADHANLFIRVGADYDRYGATTLKNKLQFGGTPFAGTGGSIYTLTGNGVLKLTEGHPDFCS